MRQRWLMLPAILVIAMFLVACGGEDGSSDADAGPTPDETRAAIESARMEILGTTWTSGVNPSSGAPVDEVENYTTISPAIVLVVEVTDVPSGTDFTASWSIDGLAVPEAEMQVTVQEDMETAWVAFEFTRNEGRYFPLGELQAVVMASSGETTTATINIELP